MVLFVPNKYYRLQVEAGKKGRFPQMRYFFLVQAPDEKTGDLVNIHLGGLTTMRDGSDGSDGGRWSDMYIYNFPFTGLDKSKDWTLYVSTNNYTWYTAQKKIQDALSKPIDPKNPPMFGMADYAKFGDNQDADVITSYSPNFWKPLFNWLTVIGVIVVFGLLIFGVFWKLFAHFSQKTTHKRGRQSSHRSRVKS